MRRTNFLWVIVVAALLVVVLAHVESGAISGLKTFSLGTTGKGISGSGGGGNSTTSTFSFTSTFTDTYLVSPTTVTSQLYISPGGAQVALSEWYLYALAAVGMILAFGFLMRGGKEGNVYDFESDLERLENERRRLERSWSVRLRNSALMNYYILVRKVGTDLGVKEGPQETPREYLERVSQELKVDPGQTSTFAAAFNRARYGQELTDSEIAEVSRFMGGFVDGLRSRMKVG